MFQLDPRTVIFVNFIYAFSVTLFFSSAALFEKYRFKGFVNWIIAFSFISLNFLILSLRSIIPVNIVIVLPHILLIWAFMEIKRGLVRFFEMKNRIWTDWLILIPLLISLLLNQTDSRLRISVICIASVLTFLDTILLFSTKDARKKTKSITIPLLFSIGIFVMTIRFILGRQWDPKGNPLETGNSLSLISILLFITCIVIFFAIFFIVVNRILQQRKALIDKMRSISLTDDLTGMMNRRGFNNVMKYEMDRFKRNQKGFTFVICDIDHFKQVNDTYGHDIGDSVLKEFGAMIKASLRKGDTAARWGGEEFVILLPETDSVKAESALERLKDEIEQHHFTFGDHKFHKTMSFGACYCYDVNIDIQTIIGTADENLYKAKEGGRNRIVMSEFL